MNQESYALITGASQGISKEISKELARRGHKLIMVALPGKELEDLSQSIRDEFKVEAHTFGIDLTQEDAPKKVFDFVQSKNLTINILINNAGFGTSGSFYKSSLEKNNNMIKLNNQAMVNITHYFINILMTQPKAYFMNVSSMEATLPLPYKSVYTATKRFIYSFSLALNEEIKDTNISMSILCPAGVITNKEGLKRVKAMGSLSKIMITMPDFVAKKAVDGMFRGKLIIIPGTLPYIIVKVMRLFPTKLKMKILERVFRTYKDLKGS